jgi:hypothetical protein
VLYTGQRAGQQYTPALGTQLYDPFENKQCRADPAILVRCLALSGSGNSQGDPIEYFLGATITTPDGGLDPNTGDPFPISGIDDPLSGLSLERNGADSAQNQTGDSSFIATGDFLEVTDPSGSFPHLESWPAAEYTERHRRAVRPAHRAAVHVVRPGGRGQRLRSTAPGRI